MSRSVSVVFIALTILSASFLIATAAPASAQASALDARSYVSGGVFADIKRFSGDTDESVFNGEAIGASIAVGTALHPRWELEIGVDIPRFTATSREFVVTLNRTTFTLESIVENQVVSVATLLRFNPSKRGRVRIGYLAGLSIVGFRRKVHTEGPPDTPSGLIPKPLDSIEYTSAPTIGIDGVIGLGEHLALVPGLHAMVFRLEDGSALSIRPRVALRWIF